MLRLRVTSGAAAGAELEVDDELVIGRGAPDLGPLAEDPEISRRHARILREGGDGYAVEDLGSRNGTLVNGRRISGSEVIYPGDSIEVGGSTLVVQVVGVAPGSDAGAPERQGALPKLVLRLEVDFEAGGALLEIEGQPNPVRLVHEDGRWRIEKPG